MPAAGEPNTSPRIPIASRYWPAFLPVWLFPIGCSALLFLPGFDRHAHLYLGCVALPLLLICATLAGIPLRRRQATWPQTLYWGGVLPFLIWTTVAGGLMAWGFWSGPMGRDLGAMASLIHGEDAPCPRDLRAFSLSEHEDLLLVPDVEYSICVPSAATVGELHVMRQVRRDSVKTVTRHIPLDEHAYARVIALFEAALDYNVRDGAMGLDGATWCLATSHGFTDVRACFLAPSPAQAATRGLQGLTDLAAALQQLDAGNAI